MQSDEDGDVDNLNQATKSSIVWCPNRFRDWTCPSCTSLRAVEVLTTRSKTSMSSTNTSHVRRSSLDVSHALFVWSSGERVWCGHVNSIRYVYAICCTMVHVMQRLKLWSLMTSRPDFAEPVGLHTLNYDVKRVTSGSTTRWMEAVLEPVLAQDELLGSSLARDGRRLTGSNKDVTVREVSGTTVTSSKVSRLNETFQLKQTTSSDSYINILPMTTLSRRRLRDWLCKGGVWKRCPMRRSHRRMTPWRWDPCPSSLIGDVSHVLRLTKERTARLIDKQDCYRRWTSRRVRHTASVCDPDWPPAVPCPEWRQFWVPFSHKTNSCCPIAKLLETVEDVWQEQAKSQLYLECQEIATSSKSDRPTVAELWLLDAPHHRLSNGDVVSASFAWLTLQRTYWSPIQSSNIQRTRQIFHVIVKPSDSTQQKKSNTYSRHWCTCIVVFNSFCLGESLTADLGSSPHELRNELREHSWIKNVP